MNSKTKRVLFAECKWQEKVNAEQVLKELKEKSRYVDWNIQEREEYYVIFSKNFSKRVIQEKVLCIDINEIK